MRKFTTYELNNVTKYKNSLFAWAQEHSHCCYLDNCNAIESKPTHLYSSYDCMVAVGKSDDLLITKSGYNLDSLRQLKEFHAKHNDWLFGFLSYDIKNETEALISQNEDSLRFPLLHFFTPEIIFLFKQNIVQIGYLESYYSKSDVNELHRQLLQSSEENNKLFFLSRASLKTCVFSYTPLTPLVKGELYSRFLEMPSNIIFESKISKHEYIHKINTLKQHIQQGDIYETNFCQEFYSRVEQFNPAEAYWNLKKISPTPFSAYYRLHNHYLMCASPERFLMKQGNKLFSQPIKGTIKRGDTPEEDDKLKTQLANDSKERSENIMIVDLVRNDLSKTAQKGSTKVEELCNIYSYEQVHQMVSTISCLLHEKAHFTDAIRACFPMGSMTGAPKIMAMELIEKYESTKRGLFSGSVGYITPEGNFDFNVVIRSLLYNKTNHYLSFMVGSAITCKSDPEKEYEECLLKAKALLQALHATIQYR